MQGLNRFLIGFALATGLAACLTSSSDYDQRLALAAVDEEQPEPLLAYGFDLNRFHVVEGAFGAGDVLSKVLMPLGVPAREIEQLVELSRPVFDVRRIQPDKRWVSLFETDTASTPSFFIFERSQRDYVVFSVKDSLSVWAGSKPTEKIIRRVEGSITHSLSKSLAELGAPLDMAIELSSIYAWTIDFYRLQPQDAFTVLYEEELIDGEPTGACTLMACSFTHGGRERKAYRFEAQDGVNYFDETGESLRKAFLKAPVKFSRISSRFTGKRFHPVLKTYKAHLGTDYAAPHGTPIVAVGDGTVSASSYTSGNGNYVKIRHNGTYETQYLHMSKRAVKQGQRVQQGEVIGYVGSTGLATGPHVCFRFWKNGQQVDHLKEEFPAAEPIALELRGAFNELMLNYNAQLNGYDAPTVAPFFTASAD
ncbi:MAG: peptidoglycan DD-metalloendopeptidase family protein [Flavobacteriales bacterium]